MSTSDYFPEMLDRVRAILTCGAGKQVELARFVLPHNKSEYGAQITVSRWIKGTSEPGAESTLRIKEWAAVKTLEIDAAGEETKAAYRVAFAQTESGKRALRAAATAKKKSV